MTIIVDIACPECGQSGPVRKESLDTYWCTACDHEFDQKDVEP